MQSTDPSATVIIPSRGLRERANVIWRAIDSVREQRGIRAVPLVVLNGAQRAPEVEGVLLADPGVRLIVRDAPGIASALRTGREAVNTPWFTALDDDDILLPDALARRVHALEAHPECDVVVTNGLIREDGSDDVLHMPAEAGVGRDPLRALLRRNWLLPGSWLARTDRMGATLFDAMPRHRECTYLALRFASEYHMRWLQEPTIVYNLGSPFAASRSREYLLGQVDALHSLLTLPLPQRVRARLRWQVAAALHEGADFLWSVGELDDAWRLHLRSLVAMGGLRFLPFTRHLLSAAWRRTFLRAGWAAE